MAEQGYFNPSKVSVRKIEKPLAEEMIVKYHYTHKWSLCQVAYGIFYSTDTQVPFFENIKDEKLIGCIVYGQPVGRSAAESISKLIKIDEVLELTRLFCHDGYGKNIESYSIAQSLRLIEQDFPRVKAIISYSDCEQGHKGTIYQASAFYYQGNSALALMPNFSISLVNSPYKWMHSRTAFSTFGSHNVEWLKKRIGHTFWRKKEATKHRYVYLLGNRVQKKKVLANLKHPFLPYPKDTPFVEQIEEIKVDSLVENPFFG
jgi:hypothetical protein